MLALLEILGLCGILGICKTKEKHRVSQMNKEWKRKKYDIDLENKLRNQIMSTQCRPDGTPLGWNARNIMSYNYITVQELRKRGYEPSPYFTTMNLDAFEFNEETGELLKRNRGY